MVPSSSLREKSFGPHSTACGPPSVSVCGGGSVVSAAGKMTLSLSALGPLPWGEVSLQLSPEIPWDFVLGG